jgi:hypothetical protein
MAEARVPRPRVRARTNIQKIQHLAKKGDFLMADEFLDHDLDTPTEADLDLAYGSQYLSSTDIGDRKIRTRITKVRKEELQGNEGRKRMKFILFFDTLDKPMVLNATNKNTLVDGLGRTPAKWIGASVGIYVDPNVTYAGKRVKGLRLRLLEAFASKPTPKPAAKPAAAEWPEEPDDPGFDPDER